MFAATRRRRRPRPSISAAVDTLLRNVPEALIMGIWSTIESNVQNSGGFVDQIDDVRGVTIAPSLVGAGATRPAWDGVGKLANFDGVDDFLRCNFLAQPFTDHTLLIIGTVPLTVTGRAYGMTSQQNITTGMLIDWQSTPSIRAVTSNAFAVLAAPGAGLKAIIGRVFRTLGTTNNAGIIVGAAAEVTNAVVGVTPSLDQLTVGSNRQNTLAGLFSLKGAVLLRDGSGAYSAALQAFATSLGAV